jgi:alkanesulfonate monooxygenase SsuD/methylene tetrahydromethanopterin reductase-like flavin-dependent oxidoreductase (luciferase family)
VNPAEGRGRLLEGMALVIKALTEPQPFSWEGRYYQFRTVSVWPRPVQQPLPPMVVATRSDDMLHYAAEHKLGLAVSFVPVDQMARVTAKYGAWCNEAGWQPTPDQIVYRGNIYLAETDKQAEAWFEGIKHAGPVPGGIALRPAVSRAIQAARAGEEFDLRHSLAGSVQGDVVGVARGLNFIGGPDTVVKQMKAFHDQCGAGVVDLFFQQPSVGHREVMQEIKLFGREVLPQIKEF